VVDGEEGTTVSAVQELSGRWTARLVDALDLVEVESLPLVEQATGDPAGALVVHEGPVRLIECRLAVPGRGIDSMMLVGWTPSDSAVPHLVTDLVVLADGWHAEVDLVPRVDLVAHAGYLDTVYPPLTPWLERVAALPGARPLDAGPRLRAALSPWTAGVVVDAEHVAALEEVHRAYQDRWVELVRGAEVGTAPAREELRARDRAHRALVYDRVTDPLWAVLDEILGTPAVDRLLDLLREPYATDPD
jgi:hypothetical protein